MKSLSMFLDPVEPWVFKSTTPFEVVFEELTPVLGAESRAKLVTFDGIAMGTFPQFYDEFVRKLDFPAYFGRNLNALDECLCDLAWLKATGFVLLIRKAEKVLCLESAESLDGFLNILNRAGQEWSQPVEDGEVWDRPPRPFHTVFLCETVEWRKDIPLFQFVKGS